MIGGKPSCASAEENLNRCPAARLGVARGPRATDLATADVGGLARWDGTTSTGDRLPTGRRSRAGAVWLADRSKRIRHAPQRHRRV